MKKLFVAVLAIVLTLSLSLFATACKKTPTPSPSVAPSVSVEESLAPSVAPTETPSVAPSLQETVVPSLEPSVEESVEPTVEPSVEETVQPTVEPTIEPTVEPTIDPTVEPSSETPVWEEMTEDEMRDYIDSIFHDKEVTYDGELHTIEIDLPEELFEIINASDFYFSQANEDGEFIELEICYLLENWYFYPTAILKIMKAEPEWVGEETQTFTADGSTHQLLVSIANDEQGINGNDGWVNVGTYEVTLSVAETLNYKASQKTFTVIIEGLTDEEATPVFVNEDGVTPYNGAGLTEADPILVDVGSPILPFPIKALSNAMGIEGYEPTDISADIMLNVMRDQTSDFVVDMAGVKMSDLDGTHVYAAGGMYTVTLWVTNDIYSGYGAELVLKVKAVLGADVDRSNRFAGGEFATNSDLIVVDTAAFDKAVSQGDYSGWSGWNATKFASDGKLTIDYENSYYFDGTGALKITAPNNGAIYKQFFLEGGYTYTISFKMRAGYDYQAGTTADCHIYLADCSIAGGNASDHPECARELRSLKGNVPTEWITVTHEFLVENDGDFRFYIKTNGFSGGSLYIDEIAVYVSGVDVEEKPYWTWDLYTAIDIESDNVLSSSEYVYTPKTELENVTFQYKIDDAEDFVDDCVLSFGSHTVTVLCKIDGIENDYFKTITIDVVDENANKTNVRFFDGDQEYTDLVISGVLGQKITLPKEQTKSGYVFKFWQINGDNYLAGAEYVIASENDTLTAVWDEIIYSNTMTVPEFTKEQGAAHFGSWHDGLLIDWSSESYLADGTGSISYAVGTGQNAQHKAEFTAVRGVMYVIGFYFKVDENFAVARSFGDEDGIYNSKDQLVNGSGFEFDLQKHQTQTEWMKWEWRWIAPETDTYYVWWQMHGIMRGTVFFDHFYCIAEEKYQENSTTCWTTAMTATAVAENKSITLNPEETEFVYDGARCEDAEVTITYSIDGAPFTDAVPVFVPGVYQLTVKFHKEGFIDYEKTAVVSVIGSDAEEFTASFVFGEDEVAEPISDYANSQIVLPDAVKTYDWKIFRYWTINFDDSQQIYAVGDSFVLTENVVFTAYYEEIITGNVIPNGTYNGNMDGDHGWYQLSDQKVYDPTVSYKADGTGSAKVTKGEAASANAQVCVDFEGVADVTYVVSFAVKSENFTIASSFGRFNLIHTYRFDGYTYENRFDFNDYFDIMNLAARQGKDDPSVGTHDWKVYSFEYTAKASKTHHIYIQMHGIVGGAVWFDNFSVVAKGSVDETDIYMTSKEAEGLLAENQTLEMEDGAAEYLAATCPEDYTLSYFVNDSTTPLTECIFNTPGLYTVKVVWTNAVGKITIQTVEVSVIDSSSNINISYYNGEEEIESQTVAVGEVITLIQAIEAAEGYFFVGWSDGNTMYSAGQSYEVVEDAIFTAVFEAYNYDELYTGVWTGWKDQYKDAQIGQDLIFQSPYSEATYSAHLGTEVTLQAGVTYRITATWTITDITVRNAGSCRADMFLANTPSAQYAINNAVTATFGFSQGQSAKNTTLEMQIEYECTTAGSYHLVLMLWGCNAVEASFTNISIKGINPNEIDPTDKVVNGSLTTSSGWSTSGGGVNGWFTRQGVISFGEDGMTAVFDGSDKIFNGYITQKMNLKLGKTYRYSFKVKKTDFAHLGSSSIHISTNNRPDQPTSDTALFYQNFQSGTSDGWEEFTGTFTVDKEGPYYLTLRVWGHSGGTISYKDVSIFEVA